METPSIINIAAVIGFLTIFFGILVKLIGFPDQIRQNYKRKSTKGLSTTFIILSFLAYVLWTVHGIFQKDIVLIIGQGAGIITTGIVFYQIMIYRKNNED